MTQTVQMKKKYKTYRNKFNKIKKTCKQPYDNGKFQESQGNIRKTWFRITRHFMKDDNIRP